VRQGEGMNFRDTNSESSDGKYLSKRVMINGQFVTLYSANGNTWVSSPEEIPALMERLDNARISLAPGEKVAEGEPAAAPAKAEPVQDDKAAAPKVLQTKYRMKGPKPRPILRQGGVVIMGTPVEPISASNAALSFSSDVEDEVEVDSKQKPSKMAAKSRTAKVAALSAKGAKGKQEGPRKKMIAPVLQRPAGAKPEASKVKGAAKTAKEAKLAPAKVVAKQVAKTAPKSASKSNVAAKASNKKKVEVKKVAAPTKKSAAASKKSAARPATHTAAKKPAKKGRSSKR
jgi:hypothetical protein